MLLMLAGGTLAFSATELKGAREVRAFISPVVDAVSGKAAQWLPSLHKSAQHVIERAVASLDGVGGQAGAPPECPPGTRRVLSLPASDPTTQTSPAEPAQDNSTKTVCVDERQVSEVEYAACAACEQPRLPIPKAKMKTRAHSEFCLTGKTPTVAPIQCTTWKQADTYCQVHAGRLPTADELRAATDATAAPAPMEWTQAAPKAGLGPFRCVSSK
jgi:hypothetical protein